MSRPPLLIRFDCPGIGPESRRGTGCGSSVGGGQTDATGPTLYRCLDCLGGHLCCKRCLHRRHRLLPFHRPERWHGHSFVRTTLAETGFKCYLGHFGACCTKSDPNHPGTKITVVHTNGIHSINVVFCSHPAAYLPYQQLLGQSMFPATHDRPETTFTFSVLKRFQLMNLASKMPIYEFHKALHHLTDSVEPASVPASDDSSRIGPLTDSCYSRGCLTECVQELLHGNAAVAGLAYVDEERENGGHRVGGW